MKTKADLLEAVAVLADAGILSPSEEEKYQDRIENEFDSAK